MRRGIRILSEWNIYCTVVLLSFFLLFSPIEWLTGFFATAVADYAWHAIPTGLWIADAAEAVAWQSDWTIFFWGWWISWVPFVGIFIARISRGRTLREFALAVLFVPTSFCILWICLLGGNAIYLELNAADGAGTAGIMHLVREFSYEAALYETIAQLSHADWLTWAMSALATLLLSTWFVTSSDSGTLVINTMLSMGDDNPPRLFRIIWGLGIGLVAAVLLLADGLRALQTASIAARAADQRRAAVHGLRPAQIPRGRCGGAAEGRWRERAGVLNAAPPRSAAVADPCAAAAVLNAAGTLDIRSNTTARPDRVRLAAAALSAPSLRALSRNAGQPLDMV